MTSLSSEFEFGAASLVVTRSSLLFIVEVNVISSLSGDRLSSFVKYLELGGKYHTMRAYAFCIILSSQLKS